jgi:hypothetical protein
MIKRTSLARLLDKAHAAVSSPLSYGLIAGPAGPNRRSVVHFFLKGTATPLCGKDHAEPIWSTMTSRYNNGPCKTCYSIAKEKYPGSFGWLKKIFYADAGKLLS